MARQFKIKRYYGKGENTFHRKPHPVSIIFVALLLFGLGYLGVVLYQPVSDFVMNIGKIPENVLPLPESSIASASEAETSEAEPEPEPKPTTTGIRAAYLPPEAVRDAARLDAALTQFQANGLNAVMIDIKNADGALLYRSQNSLAQKWDAVSPDAFDLKALVDTLSAKGFHVIARMPTFRDPLAARAGRDGYAIFYQDTEYLWLDAAAEAGGAPWLNPYSALAREYLNGIAVEAAQAGAVMVVLDDVCFPEKSGVQATFGAESVGVSRQEILHTFVADITEKAAAEGARTAVYIPAVTSAQEAARRDVMYGGNPLVILNKTLLAGVLPSQFGAGFSSEGLSVEAPLQDPAAAVKAALTYVQGELKSLYAQTEIIPFIQGGNDPEFNAATKFTAEQIQAQVAAAEALGFTEYILYSPDGSYLY